MRLRLPMPGHDRAARVGCAQSRTHVVQPVGAFTKAAALPAAAQASCTDQEAVPESWIHLVRRAGSLVERPDRPRIGGGTAGRSASTTVTGATRRDAAPLGIVPVFNRLARPVVARHARRRVDPPAERRTRRRIRPSHTRRFSSSRSTTPCRHGTGEVHQQRRTPAAPRQGGPHARWHAPVATLVQGCSRRND